MINLLLAGLGLSISLLLFQGTGSNLAVYRSFNAVDPYFVSPSVVYLPSVPEPFFDLNRLGGKLEEHFASLEKLGGGYPYSFRLQADAYQEGRRYPTSCVISLQYRGLVPMPVLLKRFNIVEGALNEG